MSASLIAQTVTYRRGRIEADRLTTALLNAAAAGRRPNCSDPPSRHLWLSEDEGERREAAKLCTGCCVADACGEAAEARQERFGVWAGKDLHPGEAQGCSLTLGSLSCAHAPAVRPHGRQGIRAIGCDSAQRGVRLDLGTTCASTCHLPNWGADKRCQLADCYK
jgi:Transcription factor WhiB